MSGNWDVAGFASADKPCLLKLNNFHVCLSVCLFVYVSPLCLVEDTFACLPVNASTHL